ncbi:MAG: 30S ribosomal protein S6 [Candidatus Omnitrophica bacterium]|nr:30S ribosomal protein S6 [Candidatus Omnitrophota bacterium]
MKAYEGMFILDTRIQSAATKEAVGFVSETIEKEGGRVLAAEEWGKKRMAYLVRGHADGFYLLVNFEIAGEKIARLKLLYQLNERILKFLILRQDEVPAKKEKPVRSESAESSEGSAEAKVQAEAPDAPEAIENKETEDTVNAG